MLLGSASRPWLQHCPGLSLTGSCSSVAKVLLVMMVMVVPPLQQSASVVTDVHSTTHFDAKLMQVIIVKAQSCLC